MASYDPIEVEPINLDGGTIDSRKPLIQARANWSDEWEVVNGLEMVKGAACAGGHDVGSMQVTRRFGLVCYPGSTETHIYDVIDLDKYWCRISLPVFVDEYTYDGQTIWQDNEGNSYVVIWIGVLQAESRQVFATPTVIDEQGDIGEVGAEVEAPTGIQSWVGLDLVNMMRKTHVARSVWYDGEHTPETMKDLHDTTKILKLNWLPDFNVSDKRNRIALGNAWKTTIDEQSYALFGGTEFWSRLDMLLYVLENLLQRRDENGDPVGPEWIITGNADVLAILAESEEIVTLNDTESVASIIRKILPVIFGLDYFVEYIINEDSTENFAVRVYSLTEADVTFDDVTLPANASSINMIVNNSPMYLDGNIVISQDQEHDDCRIIGARQVICCTLVGANATIPNRSEGQGVTVGTLDKGWSDALETEFKAAGGGAILDPAQRDVMRNGEKFKDVYCRFVPSSTWKHQNGYASPLLDDTGHLVEITFTDDVPDVGTYAQYQERVGRTFTWTPLRTNVDYSTEPPTDNNEEGSVPDLIPAMAWLYDEVQEMYVRAEDVGVGCSVKASPTSLAIYVSGSPQYKLALNHWSDAATGMTIPSYDWTKMIVTFAFMSDHHVTLRKAIGDSVSDGTVHITNATDAGVDMEWWYMAPKTIFDIQKVDSSIVPVYNDEGIILRDDTSRMKLAMCGEIARYYKPRCKVEMTLKGLWPYSFLLGRIWSGLFTDQEGWQDIKVPFTSVEWICSPGDGKSPGEHRTVIRGGFAR